MYDERLQEDITFKALRNINDKQEH